tara:strand:- start:38 stop:235 length:198 start_codon:yes stop_codon:yes gene_type:complete
MIKTLKQIANTAAEFSTKGKVQALIASPVATIAILGIKSSEITEDIKQIWDGQTYKNKNSRKPTK